MKNMAYNPEYPEVEERWETVHFRVEKTVDDTLSETQKLIADECDALKELLLEKNRKYGDAAVNPIRLFSKASAKEQILVRLDDKLNRFMNRADDEDEDVILDMLGYLILYRITTNV